MASTSPERTWQVIDEYVAAFEAARACDSAVDAARFLPSSDHPQFLAIQGELVRVDLEFGWRDGFKPRLESYRARFPELFRDTTRLGEAAYEEYRLRLQAGEHPLASDYEQRFSIDASTWERDDVEEDFPPLGSKWGEFRLLRELGRGSFARVYLAQQSGLANRLVALKLSTKLHLESQTLAQLQHSHIVPIYSTHVEGRWQGLCMPYLGATTLADLTGSLRRRERLPRRGSELVDTVVARRSATVPIVRRAPLGGAPPEAPGDCKLMPTMDVKLFDPLPRLSYVEAALWIAARTADGLAHAHARGIVHQDLKPANILLADDGRPMLLDFNLSTDAKRPTDQADLRVGGTLPYMAPEQLVALRAGESAATPRGDLYALGVVLFELLSGRSPFAPLASSGDVVQQTIDSRKSQIPRLRTYNPAVTPAVESIVGKCLAIDPEERYGSADDLREDLDRQLTHRALRHAPNTSLAERGSKFARRHGRRVMALGALAAAAVVIALLNGAVWARQQRAERLAALAAVADTESDARTIQLLLSQPDPDAHERSEAERRARELAERYSLLEPSAISTNALWQPLPDDARRRVATDLAAVADFWRFDLEQRLAHASATEPRRAEWSVAVKKLTASRNWLTSTGGAPRANLDQVRAALVSGDLSAASQELTDATRAAPNDFTAWSLFGHVQMFQGNYADAMAAFTVCRALWPESPWPPYYRGQARYKAREFAAALADFDLVVQLKPDWAEARYQRALARLAARQLAAALEDLAVAEKSADVSSLRLLCLRARIHQALGKRDEAARDLAEALAVKSSDDKVGLVSRGVARLQMRDAQGALADFEAALALDPEYRAALENKAHVLSEQLDRPAEAVAVLDQTIERYPSYVAAIGGRGVLRARQGDRASALADAEKALQLDDGGLTLYQVAGIYALTSRQKPDDQARAMQLLREALRQGYGYDLLKRDPDLNPLRESAEFQALLRAADAVQLKAGDQSAARN